MKNFKKTLFLTLGLISIVLISVIVFNTKNQIQASIDCCYHECRLADVDQCDGNTVQKCGECDSDAYNDWCDSTTCSGGDICQDGICQIPASACSINCITGPGCRSLLLNATIDSTKECCGVGKCYNCNIGYYWNSTSASCVQNCIDNDSDGYGIYNATHCSAGDDCDDNDKFSYPGGIETCDNKDNNCNGTVDEGCDDDNDGYCDSTMKFYNYPVLACLSTYVSDGQFGNDCNDTVNTIYFDASEVCDGIDNNCDGTIDEGCTCVNGDTQICGLNIGECKIGTSTCSGGTWSSCIGQIIPIMEVCDGLDNNCDGVIDENCDSDNDNYCDCGKTYTYGSDLTAICSGTNTTDANSIANTCDCDDNLNSIYPTTIEVCNGMDDNCDGTIDEGCPCINGVNQSCGSNIGECQQGTQLCTAGAWGACVGGIISVLEICDGKDNDCDGSIDEDLSAPLNINQQGVCAGSFKVCGGIVGWQNDYSSVVSYENPETSCGDGVDNDCNGSDLVCSATCPDGICDVAGGECSTCATDCVCINTGDTGCDMTGKSFCCGNITGNSITDVTASEVCDIADGALANMDLNGETCNSIGYVGGGTLSCRWDCKNYDPSSCVGAPGTCGNNVCDVGETSVNCPTECAVSCVDNDGDGYGVCPNCDIVNGCTNNGNDCDDRIMGSDMLPGIGSFDDDMMNGVDDFGEVGFPFSDDGRNINPGVIDICGNGVDEDCNGSDLACGCIEDWTCAPWLACTSGIQTTTCTDNNSCGTTNNKPDEMQSCLSLAIVDPNDGFKVAQDGFNFNMQAIALGGTEPYVYEWKDEGTVFGDDQLCQNLDPSTMNIGNHTILVQVTDANSSIANDSIIIEILPAGILTASIQMWQTEFAKDSMGAMFGVDAQGGTAPYTFQWESDKLVLPFSTEQWPMIDVSAWALGTHTITITATDSVGATASDTIDIEIVEISLDIWPQEGESFIFGENVNFNAMVQSGTMPYVFQWMSDKDGDITPATEPKDWFQKNDLSEGLHTITLTVTDSSVTPITVSKQVHITINSVPILTAVIDSPINNSTHIQGDDISFQASVDGGIWSYTYIWNSSIDGELRNGQVITDKDFIINNLSVGNHTITFTVKDGSGQTATEMMNLTIASSNPIIANIALPNTGDNFYEGDSVICFTSNVSGGVNPYAYQWNSNIDNNNISDKDEFCTTNLSQGNHTITLIITDQNGNTQSDAINIIVNPEPNFTNTKDMSKYSAKEAFLISHKNWQDVLSLTPIAVWQGNKYPMLVYHEESSNSLDLNNVKLDTGSTVRVLPYTDININQIGGQKYIWSNKKCDGGINGILIIDKYFTPTNINVGGSTVLNVKIKNCSNTETKNFTNIKLEDYAYKEGMAVANAFQFFGTTLAPREEKIVTFNFSFNNPVSTFDTDSAIHFLQLYNPSNLTTIGTTLSGVNNLLVAAPQTGAGLAGKVSNINSSDYSSYWSNINSIVAVDYNNYHASHNAAVFASYKNAPIIFVNSANLVSYQSLIKGKIVYTVGDLDVTTQNYIDNNAGTKINYSLEELQRWYVQKTNTDKVILINIDDLNNSYQDFDAYGAYDTDKSSNIYNLFQRISLSSSLLAAAKNELIIPATFADIPTGSSPFLGTEIEKLFPFPLNDKILTIIGTRDMIYSGFFEQFRGRSERSDNHISAIGRITGVTSADSFSYVNRSIFFQELFNNKYPGVMHKELAFTSNTEASGESEILRNSINEQEYIDYWSFLYHRNNLNASHFEQRQFVRFIAHGSESGPAHIWRGNLPYLDLSLGIAGSCSTGGFNGSGSFGNTWLRKGGISYYGAVVPIRGDEALPAYYHSFDILRDNPNISLGAMFNQLVLSSFISFGDPTLNLIYRGGTNELPSSMCHGNKVGDFGGVQTIYINSGESVWLIGNSGDEDGTVVNNEWDFDGDGIYDLSSLSDSEQVTHTYSTAGSYKAKFRATDDKGAISTTFIWVIVN
ncbi:PKD domain-containing protein [Candidatus Parcubacteria bacterium]|nr:PKD domain-containing protein [Candidatus Parcubacteria bacterium]